MAQYLLILRPRMAAENQIHTTIISRIPPKRILMVEDSPDVAETMTALLTGCGHGVEVSRDGKDALASYRPGKYDLVITDYSMPRMNGVELAEIIKGRSPKQRILLATAYAFTIAACDSRPLPVDAVLRKPFQPRDLNEVLNRLFLTSPETQNHFPVTV